jgi:hypothetical protein
MPIFIGAFGVRGARLAGRLGEGLLSLRPDQLAPYRDGLSEGGHPLGAAAMTGLVNLILSSDPERAWVHIAPHLAYQMASYAHYGAESRQETDTNALAAAVHTTDVEMLRSQGPVMTLPHFDIVTPDEAARRLTRWLAPLPVDEIFFWDSIAGMPDELVNEHLDLLARLKTQLALPDSPTEIG